MILLLEQASYIELLLPIQLFIGLPSVPLLVFHSSQVDKGLKSALKNYYGVYCWVFLIPSLANNKCAYIGSGIDLGKRPFDHLSEGSCHNDELTQALLIYGKDTRFAWASNLYLCWLARRACVLDINIKLSHSSSKQIKSGALYIESYFLANTNMDRLFNKRK